MIGVFISYQSSDLFKNILWNWMPTVLQQVQSKSEAIWLSWSISPLAHWQRSSSLVFLYFSYGSSQSIFSKYQTKSMYIEDFQQVVTKMKECKYKRVNCWGQTKSFWWETWDVHLVLGFFLFYPTINQSINLGQHSHLTKNSHSTHHPSPTQPQEFYVTLLVLVNYLPHIFGTIIKLQQIAIKMSCSN